MVVVCRSRDFPVEWTRETFSTPDKLDVDRRVLDRVIKAADRQDAAALFFLFYFILFTTLITKNIGKEEEKKKRSGEET